MGIKIITDSTSEITQLQSKEFDVPVVPIKTIFSGKEYREGVDIMSEEFYQKLEQLEELPTTSQPSPGDFETVFRKAIEEGNTDIILICISSKLSGTLQSAIIARGTIQGSEDVPDANIHIIDSENATIGLNLLVQRAITMRDAGKSAEEIVETIEAAKKKLRLCAAIETLDYLHKGGRLSTTSKIAGTLLNVKPLISVVDGEIKVMGKCRGMKKACDEVLNMVDGAGGIDFDYPVALGYTGERERFVQFEEVALSYLKGQDAGILAIGAAIGTHVGPGAVAIAFFVK